MKRINARTAFICLLAVLVLATHGLTEDYYIYKTAKGELVISDKPPPPGSTIIKQLPGETDGEIPQAQEPSKPQPNVQPEGSPNTSKNK